MSKTGRIILDPGMLIGTDDVQSRGWEIKSNMKKSSWNNCTPGNLVKVAEPFSDDDHGATGLPVGATMDVGVYCCQTSHH